MQSAPSYGQGEIAESREKRGFGSGEVLGSGSPSGGPLENRSAVMGRCELHDRRQFTTQVTGENDFLHDDHLMDGEDWAKPVPDGIVEKRRQKRRSTGRKRWDSAPLEPS